MFPAFFGVADLDIPAIFDFDDSVDVKRVQTEIYHHFIEIIKRFRVLYIYRIQITPALPYNFYL
jgi:hypothetical protein